MILQGALKQAGDLIGVIAERNTAPGAKHEAANLISTGAAGGGCLSPRGISGKSGAVSDRMVCGMVSSHDASRSNTHCDCSGGRGERLSGGGERGCIAQYVGSSRYVSG